MKNSLMKKDDIIIRILEEKEDKVFVIDCIKLTTSPIFCIAIKIIAIPAKIDMYIAL